MTMVMRLERQLPWLASLGFHLLLALLLFGHWNHEERVVLTPPSIRAVVLEKPQPNVPARAPRPPVPQKVAEPPRLAVAKPLPAKPAVTKPKPAPAKPKPLPDFSQPDMAAQMARENIAMAKAAQPPKPVETAPASSGVVEDVEADSETLEAVAAIKSALAAKWQRPPSARNGMVVELQIQLLPGGDVQGVTVVKSSGDKTLDASAVSAVQNASPLPVPSGKAFDKFRRFILHFRPEDLRL